MWTRVKWGNVVLWWKSPRSDTINWPCPSLPPSLLPFTASYPPERRRAFTRPAWLSFLRLGFIRWAGRWQDPTRLSDFSFSMALLSARLLYRQNDHSGSPVWTTPILSRNRPTQPRLCQGGTYVTSQYTQNRAEIRGRQCLEWKSSRILKPHWRNKQQVPLGTLYCTSLRRCHRGVVAQSDKPTKVDSVSRCLPIINCVPIPQCERTLRNGGAHLLWLWEKIKESGSLSKHFLNTASHGPLKATTKAGSAELHKQHLLRSSWNPII